jgi:hypothetical protein
MRSPPSPPDEDPFFELLVVENGVRLAILDSVSRRGT